MRISGLKRLTSIILVSCMIIGLAACGSSGKSKESSDNTGNKSSTAKKIVFWNLYYNTQNESDKDKSKDELFINKAIKKFEEENSGLSVEVLTPPMDNYYNMVKAACVAKNGPDIVMSWTGGPLMDYTKFFLSLDKYFSKEEQAKLTGWDLCKDGFKADGAIKAVPLGKNGGVYVYYYNKSLFKKAGVDPNTKPETWDDFLALCAELKKGGVTPFIIGDKEGYDSAWAMGQLWFDLAGMDGIAAIREGKQTFAKDTTFKEAFTAWKKLFDLGYTNADVTSLAQADGQAKFLAGEGAMEVGWSNISKDVYSALGEDTGWFPMPHIRKDAPFVNTFVGGYAGYCFSITDFSKVPEEAVKFIKYMTSKETQDWFVEETQFDFSNNVDSKVPEFKTNPVMAWMGNYMNTTKNKPAVQWDSILQGDLAIEIYNMSGAMFGGKMNIDDALKKFDEKHTAITAK